MKLSNGTTQKLAQKKNLNNMTQIIQELSLKSEIPKRSMNFIKEQALGVGF